MGSIDSEKGKVLERATLNDNIKEPLIPKELLGS